MGGEVGKGQGKEKSYSKYKKPFNIPPNRPRAKSEYKNTNNQLNKNITTIK